MKPGLSPNGTPYEPNTTHVPDETSGEVMALRFV